MKPWVPGRCERFNAKYTRSKATAEDTRWRDNCLCETLDLGEILIPLCLPHENFQSDLNFLGSFKTRVFVMAKPCFKELCLGQSIFLS